MEFVGEKADGAAANKARHKFAPVARSSANRSLTVAARNVMCFQVLFRKSTSVSLGIWRIQPESRPQPRPPESLSNGGGQTSASQ